MAHQFAAEGRSFPGHHAPVAGYYHSSIARDKGFFDEEGVNVELTIVEDIDANLQAFVDGKADAAFGLQSDAMLLAAQGLPVKIVYVVDHSNGGDVVISHPDIRTIPELKGKRIGVDKLNGFNHVFMAELLQLNGLTEDDVEILPIKASAVPTALADGTIDAGQTWEPYTSESLANGYRLLASTADAPGIVTDVLMVRSDTLERRGPEIRALLKGLFRALEYRDQQESDAYAIMSAATGVAPGKIKNRYQGRESFPQSCRKQSGIHTVGRPQIPVQQRQVHIGLLFRKRVDFPADRFAVRKS